MLDESIQELVSRSLARIASAGSADELETVRVEALGRKGALALVSKDMGKLSPEDRKRIGQLGKSDQAEWFRGNQRALLATRQNSGRGQRILPIGISGNAIR